jgi:hypothetical protein
VYFLKIFVGVNCQQGPPLLNITQDDFEIEQRRCDLLKKRRAGQLEAGLYIRFNDLVCPWHLCSRC